MVVKGEGKTFFCFLQEEKSVHAITFFLCYFLNCFFFFFLFPLFLLLFGYYLFILYFCVFCFLFCFFNSTDIFDTRGILLRSGNCNIFGRFFV